MNKTLIDHKFELHCKDFTVKEGSDTTLIISGFANTTTKDRVGDVILEEAWTKGGLDNYLKNPIVLAYHDPSKPIGEVVDYGVNNKGLHVIAEISKAAGDVYDLIKANVLKAFSVGFRVKDADYDTDTDIFVIKDLELYELSVVSIPANADSIFSVAKSFENEEDYLKFKTLYSKEEEVKDIHYTKDEVDELLQEALDNTEENNEMTKETISLTQEELDAKMTSAVDAKLASIAAEKAEEDKISKLAIDAGTTGAERLIKEFEDRMTEKDATMTEALDGLRSEIKEKNEELEAMTRSKMSFGADGKKKTATDEEIDTAVLASKIMGMDLKDTKYFGNLVTKLGDHLADMGGADGTSPEDWENLFSTRLYQDIQDRTIIEPMLVNKVAMTSRTITFPWNPEAGYAEWIADTAYKSDDGTSTGTGAEHRPTDNTIKAEKMATKEYLGYEEEEDAIIPLVPIIRAAIARRMVRSTDKELLLGDTTDQGSGAGLIEGLTFPAKTLNTGGDYQYQQPGTTGDPVTIADLQQTRRLMGRWGLMPGDLTYVVSQSVMYDLMEDPDFRTMDLVGGQATILRGQVGSVNGSPVVVSDAFDATGTGVIQAVAMTTANHLFGTLRGLMVERDKNIEDQKHVIVSTRRFGITEIIPTLAVATHVTNSTQPRCPVTTLLAA